MIAWFAKNDVAANLLMLLIFALGISALTRIPLEVFPEFESDIVQITVPFPGATPAEVETGIVLRIEDAIADLRGIEEINAVARENSALIFARIDDNYNTRELLEDIKNRVDGISTFPAEAERPIISLTEPRHEVISALVSGPLPERELRQLGEQVRDELSALPEISQVELIGVRPYEISIEISRNTLTAYGLSFAQVAQAIDNHSVDLSAGVIKTRSGEILLTTRGQAYSGPDFARIPVITRADGSRILLGDIATIHDGFEDVPLEAEYNHVPVVAVEVYRSGDENAMDVAAAVRDYVATTGERMPEGVTLGYWRDRSKIIENRLGTLVKSAIQGGLIIFLLLTLFLRPSVAFWVCVGIPISFMGAIALMPFTGVTINIISLFAFIVVLGIVVDDAIVTGENIYTHLKRNGDPLRAAIEGTREVAVPVTFGLLTTIAAFLPLFMIEGRRGQVFAQIPSIVIPVLLFSLVESKLILPAHLKHLSVHRARHRGLETLRRFQVAFANSFERVINGIYRPLLAAALRQRYLTLALFIGFSLVIYSLVIGGHIGYVFFPRVQSETATATLTLPPGTPFEVTQKHIDRITAEAEKLRGKYIEPETGKSIIKGILSTSGWKGGSDIASHIGRVKFEITPPEKRSLGITSSELVREWRKNIGTIPGAEELTFRSEIGRGGDPIDIQLTGEDMEELRAVGNRLKEKLRQYPGIYDITDSLGSGKEEIRLTLKPRAQTLGITQAELAQQVRHAFFGLEVQRIQRGRDDVRVMLRYPESERQSIADLNNMTLRTADGTEIPFTEVAEARIESTPTVITRVDRKRTLNVRADANKETTDLEAIKRDLVDNILPEVLANHPDIHYTLEGEAREQSEMMQSIKRGGLLAMFLIYALLAIPFRSYVQPLIVMLVIPFGIVCAVLGHMILGMTLSISSILGMLALSGVVVNDSLVLVDYINRRRREGMPITEAVTTAGAARFRAVWLTSLTTFAGLMPLIFEKSTQAQFLIPMAVSLGFGILFATFITLLLVPINYRILDDLRQVLRLSDGVSNPNAS